MSGGGWVMDRLFQFREKKTYYEIFETQDFFPIPSGPQRKVLESLLKYSLRKTKLPLQKYL